jgi:tetratricopeptide (TPR) repeat protein
MRTALLTAVTVCLFATTASADMLLLKDGRIVDGKKLTKTADGVTIKYENGEVKVPQTMIQEVVIEGKSDFVPKTDKEKEQFAKGLVPFRGRWLTLAQREREVRKLADEKRAELAELKELRYWRNARTETTKHFNFKYNVPPHIFTRYRDMMEAYYSEFAKTWKVGQPKDLGKLHVAFYGDLKKFHQVGGVGGGVQGYFKFVKPLELHCYYNRLDPDYSSEVLFHEANHYLQMLLDPNFVMPHFPSESLAEYYGGARWDAKRKKLTVGLIQEGRLAGVHMDIKKGKMWGLSELVGKGRVYEHYSWGWTLVHFLMQDKKLAKKFRNWVTNLARGKSIPRVPQGNAGLTTVSADMVWSSFRKFMGLKSLDDVADLEKRWHKYVLELKVTSARGLDIAARKAYGDGWPALSRRLFREAIEAGSTNPVTYWRYGLFRAQKAKYDDAKKYIGKAIELDPLVSEFYADMARVLDMSKDRKSAVRMAKLAMEIDPDDVYLELRVIDLIEGD